MALLRTTPALLALAVYLPAQTFTSIYGFTAQGGGYQPWSSVTVGAQGQLYGTTFHGGFYGFGAIYELAPPASPGATWTETVLHSFSNQNGDAYPTTGVALGSEGALYGVIAGDSSAPAPYVYGAVYQLRPPGDDRKSWTESVLYQFTDGADGESPEADLVFGPGRSLYGTTTGGSGATYGGTVFELTPPSAAGGEWTQTALWSFAMGPSKPGHSLGALAFHEGRIYGTTQFGGDGGSGTVFQLTPPASGSTWTEAILHSFPGESGDGIVPYAGVVIDAKGVLYGTTESGGLPNQDCPHGWCGMVFSLTPPTVKGGTWTETILHSFTGAINGDGGQPYGGVILGPNGVLYGTAFLGGSTNQMCGWGCGIVYELIPPTSPGGTWAEVILHTFTGADGAGPYAGLTLGPDGTLYGTTRAGGAANEGTVFTLVP